MINTDKTNKSNLMLKSGEISPQTQPTKMGNEFVVEREKDIVKRGEITPGATSSDNNEKADEIRIWFQNPINCISKWSKALKTGVIHSMRLGADHTASMGQRENDKHGFSFFL